MSWLFKSRGDDDDDREPSSPTTTTTHGSIKEDLSSVIRGVAAFLAPPPSPPSVPPLDERRLSSDSPTQLALVGIRNDLAEIRGNFTNFASNLLQFPSKRDRDSTSRRSPEFDQVPGISDEVVDFAIKIATRPGCWTDFPLSLNTEFVLSEAQRADASAIEHLVPGDLSKEQFELSEAQRAHASAIEHLVPGLVAVKNEVSSFMDNQHFWLIYFILLMPRLNGHDFELLATCKVFETRDQLLLKLQKKEETGSSKSSVGHEEGSSSRATETVEGVIDKIETLKIEQREISDESSEERQRSFRDEEVISFSDLDVDDLSEKPSSNRSTLKRPASNASGSSWVQLSRSQAGHSKDSEGDSSDWLPIGDSD